MRKNSITPLMTEIAIMAAVGFVLDELQGVFFKGIFFNGGSIGFAMVAVLIIAFRRGAIPALITGLIIGGLDIMTSAYIVHPFQVFLDYIFPYAFVGFAGVFKYHFDKYDNKGLKILFICLGTLLAGGLKLLSHFGSGVLFFVTTAQDLWGMTQLSPAVYSLIYNGAYMLPCTLLSMGIMVAIEWRAPMLLKADRLIESDFVDDRDPFAYISTFTLMGGGAFLFVFYLIRYIMSVETYEDDGAWGYDFDPDSMVIFVFGLFTLLASIQSLYRIIKHKHSNAFYMGTFSMIVLSSLIYGVARMIKMFNKGKDPTTYIIWSIAAGVLFVTCIVLWIITYKKRNVRVPRTD